MQGSSREETGIIYWLCSYTPVEIIAACNLVPSRLLFSETAGAGADIHLHATLCSYVRSALASLLNNSEREPWGTVILNSCNAACHLHNALSALFPQKFHHLLDLPHHKSDQAVDFWAGELCNFHKALARFQGIEIQTVKLLEKIALYREYRQRLADLYFQRQGDVTVRGSELLRLTEDFMQLPLEHFKTVLELVEERAAEGKRGRLLNGPRLLLMGSAAGRHLAVLLEDLGGVLVLDDLCLGRRGSCFDLEPAAGEDPYHYLARLYLSRWPCARMKDGFSNLTQLEKLLQDYRIDGVILNTIKFCDTWYYLGQRLKEQNNHIPVLVLEGEYMTSDICGQFRTRIAAFLEMIS